MIYSTDGKYHPCGEVGKKQARAYIQDRKLKRKPRTQQCAAITLAGNRCSRRVSGKRLCGIHEKSNLKELETCVNYVNKPLDK